MSSSEIEPPKPPTLVEIEHETIVRLRSAARMSRSRCTIFPQPGWPPRRGQATIAASGLRRGAAMRRLPKGIDPYSLADLALTEGAGSQRLGNCS
jgi:hypothetical protein